VSLSRTEAISVWNQHIKKSKALSEGQLKKNHDRHILAAQKIREGLNPYEIYR
jgi:hypothetical protein